LVAKIWLEIGEKELVVFEEEKKKKLDYLLSIPGEVSLIDWGIKIKSEVIERKSSKFSNQNQNIAFLDQEKLQKPLRLRNRSEGDRFKPLGMKGTKTLADFFIDAKVPSYSRDEVPILTSKGKIVWVVGYRISDEFKVTEKTRRIMKIEVTFY
jgi:tRNA(Ile)-lysidine synthase